MRIAHINNISGVASLLAEEQSRLDYQTDVFVFNKKIFKQFGRNQIKYNYRSPISRWRFFRKLDGYDIWHYHYPYGSLKRSLEKRYSDRIYLKHYHGDDLRGKQEDDFCVVSTPDLLKYAQNGKWLPNPIKVPDLVPKSTEQHNRIPRVAHYPHYKMYAAEDYYSHALKSLEDKKKCEVIRILHLPYDQALATISTCDIVVGKILPSIGWIGKFELEAMALGKPVIGFVSDELYEKYKPPLYRTTKESFREDLEALLEDKNERDRLAVEGPAHIQENYNVQDIVKTLQTYYDNIG